MSDISEEIQLLHDRIMRVEKQNSRLRRALLPLILLPSLLIIAGASNNNVEGVVRASRFDLVDNSNNKISAQLANIHSGSPQLMITTREDRNRATLMPEGLSISDKSANVGLFLGTLGYTDTGIMFRSTNVRVDVIAANDSSEFRMLSTNSGAAIRIGINGDEPYIRMYDRDGTLLYELPQS